MTTTCNLVLGDQINAGLSALDGFDTERDRIWMAENDIEATHVWSHKKRLVLFFAAMRHHRDALRERGMIVHYHALQSDRRHDSGPDFARILTATIRRLDPQRLVMTECGDHRVQRMLSECASDHELTLENRPDPHFYCSARDFNDWADRRNGLLLEDFYRDMVISPFLTRVKSGVKRPC